MKEFEFYCDDADDITDITKKLFIEMEATDPESIYYNRQLDYPTINWRGVIFRIIGSALFIILSTYILIISGLGIFIAITLPSLIVAICILINLRKVFIFLIEMYQSLAPKSIRMKCRFEPSCSQYMILAIQKYGALKGVLLGLKRLKRCKIGNGGYDFP